MQDDGAAVGAFVDEVDGAAADFDAVGEDVAVGVGAGLGVSVAVRLTSRLLPDVLPCCIWPD